MCEFVSWIEKGKKVYFLTGKQVFHTQKGKDLIQKQCSEDDYVGHGAIRLYYGLEQDDGVNREYTSFSSPYGFPSVIVKAIKNGDMRGLAIPKSLLTQPVLAEYEKIQQSAWTEYKKIRQSALAEYEKIQQSAFWDLFAINDNRNPAWQNWK